MMAQRRDPADIFADANRALNDFEDKIREFGRVIDDLEAETKRQREQRRRGWL